MSVSKPTTKDTMDLPVRYCSTPQVPERIFGPDVDPNRASFIVDFGNKWLSGTELSYCFLQQTTDKELNIVRNAFKTWKDVGIGITFREVTDPNQAMIRIAFKRGDGAWSYVGRYLLNIPASRPTMNFGWDLVADGAHGVDTAIHEIGHSLGLQHEHQNPNAGIIWNEQAVIDYFSGPPNNWSIEKIRHNILDKLPPSEARGSNWDKDSIMEYAFKAGLINKPEIYKTTPLRPAGGLSAIDKSWIRTTYPPLGDTPSALTLLQSVSYSLAPGEQKEFIFEPNYTRIYTIQTFGTSDSVLAIYELDGQTWRYLTTDDDSGVDKNAKITRRLHKGRKYSIRLRLYYAARAGETAIMVS